MYDDLDFSRVLREILARRGLSAGDLAKATGLSRQAIYQILNGKTRTPKRSTLDKMAAFLDVPPGQLLRGELPEDTPEFLRPDEDILAQVPDVVGPELEAVIEREMPDRTPLLLDGPSSKARQDVLKMKLYLILKKRKLSAPEKSDSLSEN
ncbi:MAG: helix-turn-helix transcriptional regulator [bacterium]